MVQYMNKISRYSPKEFSKFVHGENNLWRNETLTDFFIVSLASKEISLNLPIKPHRKDVYDFLFITKGEAIQTIYNEQHLFTANSLRVLSPEKIRTIDRFSEDIEGYYIHFSEGFIAPHGTLKTLNYILEHLEKQNDFKIDLQVTEKIILHGLLNRLQTLDNETKKNLHLISAYLTCFLEEVRAIQSKSPLMKLNVYQTLILRFRKLFNDNINKSYGIQDYADLLHVTPNHLNKCIKAQFGITASEFINQSLITEAKALLGITEMSISEVASAIGIDDYSYFSRFFKKHTGITPRAYRKMIDLSS